MPGRCFSRSEKIRLVLAGLVVLLSFVGRPVILLFLGGAGADSPKHRSAAVGQNLTGPDGTRLYMEATGRQDAPALVLTHGWGLTRICGIGISWPIIA